jgi:hypothetical protein
MGYHVTLLRSSQGKQIPISLEEASAAAAALDGWSYSDTPPTFTFAAADTSFCLWYQEGELWTKNPDEGCIDAMLALAKRLNARVRGDEGETYDAGTTYQHPDDIQLQAEMEAASKVLIAGELKRQKFFRNAIVGFFVLLGGIGFLVGKWLERH